jgi:hypothetical protein
MRKALLLLAFLKSTSGMAAYLVDSFSVAETPLFVTTYSRDIYGGARVYAGGASGGVFQSIQNGVLLFHDTRGVDGFTIKYYPSADITENGLSTDLIIQIPSLTGRFGLQVNASKQFVAGGPVFVGGVIDRAGTYEIPFSSFRDSGPGAFANTFELSFAFRTEPGIESEIVIDEIRAVPEPPLTSTTAVAILFVFLGGIFSKRKRFVQT